MEKVKPCLFCGERAVVASYEGQEKNYIFCSTCDYRSPGHKIVSEAVQKHNDFYNEISEFRKRKTDDESITDAYWRKHYAGLAMQGVLSNPNYLEAVDNEKDLTKLSVRCADSLLAELAQKEVKS